MALEVYFKSDIERVLKAGLVSMLAAHLCSSQRSQDYCLGLFDKTQHDAVAFGISWPELRQGVCEELGVLGQSWLLAERRERSCG